MSPRGFVLPIICALVQFAPGVQARPVQIGKYTVIAYGISPEHPYPTQGVDAARTGCSRHKVPARVPHLVWQTRLNIGAVLTPLLLSGENHYAATIEGLFAMDAN